MVRLIPSRAPAAESTGSRTDPRVPRPLLALLGAVFVLGLAWALIVPPWQVPDEDHHFAYVQSIGERGALPEAGGKEQSTEQRLATGRSNAEQTAQVLLTKLEWSPAGYARWQDETAALPSSARADGGGSNPAATNPPLFYLYAAVPYTLAHGGDVFDRLYLTRVFSVAFLLLTTIGAWLLAGEVLGKRRPLQLAAAAVTGLEPMVSFVSASVNPDSLLYALWSLALWLGVRVLRRGLTLGSGAALFGIIGLGTVTKATTLVLIPAALFVLLAGLWRLWRGDPTGRPGRARVLGPAVAAVVLLAALAGGWVAVSAALGRPALFQIGSSGDSAAVQSPLRLLFSYLWQFYLPGLPFMREFTGFPPLPAYDFWLKGSWGAFGSLEVRLPEPVYLALAALVLASIAAAAVAVVRARRRRRLDPAVLAFFALAVAALVGGLHWVEYQTLLATGGPFNQGRYLLPLTPLAGIVAATALTVVREPWRRFVLAGGLGGLAALQILSLALVMGRFYA